MVPIVGKKGDIVLPLYRLSFMRDPCCSLYDESKIWDKDGMDET